MIIEPSNKQFRAVRIWLIVLIAAISGAIGGLLSILFSFVILKRNRWSLDGSARSDILPNGVPLAVPQRTNLNVSNKAYTPASQHRWPVPFAGDVQSPSSVRLVPPALGEIGQTLVGLHERLRGFSLYRHYAWAILPFVIVMTISVNNHTYYDTFKGYDMPPHFDNMFSIMRTGLMPRQTSWIWEAYQPPTFYVLTAWIGLYGEQQNGNGYVGWIPTTLFLLSVVWTLVVIGFVQNVLRRVHPILKGLTVCVIMFIPVNVMIATLYDNDLPATILLLVALIMLWYMLRSGRYMERKLWIRSAAVIGISLGFKGTASVALGVYVLLAGNIGFLYAREHRYGKLMRIAFMTTIGLPLMLVPFAINTWHTIDSVGNPYGATVPKQSVFGTLPLSFFTTFDTTVFTMPYAKDFLQNGHLSGERSFWTLQYVTMHSDYYNNFVSASFNTLPEDMLSGLEVNATQVPLARLRNAQLLEYLGIPITLIMLFGFAVSVYQVVRRPRRALRDGSILIVLLAVVAEGAQFLRFSDYADVRAVLIHARFLSATFIILFIIGMMWLWRLWAQQSWRRTTGLALVMTAYAVVACLMMWLPPV